MDLGWRALGLEPAPADSMPTGYDTGSVITPAEPSVAKAKPDDVFPEDAPEASPDPGDPTVAEPIVIEPARARREARPSPPPPERGHRGFDTGIVLTPAPPPDEVK